MPLELPLPSLEIKCTLNFNSLQIYQLSASLYLQEKIFHHSLYIRYAKLYPIFESLKKA